MVWILSTAYVTVCVKYQYFCFLSLASSPSWYATWWTGRKLYVVSFYYFQWLTLINNNSCREMCRISKEITVPLQCCARFNSITRKGRTVLIMQNWTLWNYFVLLVVEYTSLVKRESYIYEWLQVCSTVWCVVTVDAVGKSVYQTFGPESLTGNNVITRSRGSFRWISTYCWHH